MFLNDEHMYRFYKEVDNPNKNRNYGIAMFVLTGMPQLYDRLGMYIDKEAKYIDFAEIFENVRVSRGEERILNVAWNLYNGASEVNLYNIKSYCDKAMCRLASYAIQMFLLDGVM